MAPPDTKEASGCKCCDEPATSVIDDIGDNDESCSVVIVGGGPHALAALAALNEGSLAFEQFGNDGFFESRIGFKSLNKVGSVCVIDPGSHFNEAWNTRFKALDIKHLRSPAFAHPVAFEASALTNFAIREGRTAELIDAPFASKWLATLEYQDPLIKALPSSALFRDFCASLESKLPHRWLSGVATGVCKDESTGKYRVHYTVGAKKKKVVAHAVILATGAVGKWNIPPPFEPHFASSPLILHTESMLAKSTGTLSEEVVRRCQSVSARVLVIGGGISAAQAALAAARSGHQVVLRSRRPLMTRPFDIDAKWLDARMSERLRFKFLSLPVEQRPAAIREAVSGGSVPARYMEDLQRLSQTSSNSLRIEVDEDIDCSKVHIDEGGEHVVVNGESFALVILATGVVNKPCSCSPVFQSVVENFEAPSVHGLPCVDSTLRWLPDEDLFVLGANAVVELGPGGLNLMGAMRGGRIVSKELHDLMWSQPAADENGKNGTAAFANPFAVPGESSEEESEDEESEDEEEKAKWAAAMAEAQAAREATQAKAAPKTKAEIALAKARRHRKATKPRRGGRSL